MFTSHIKCIKRSGVAQWLTPQKRNSLSTSHVKGSRCDFEHASEYSCSVN